MTTLLSMPVAATVIAIDESGGASLTDVARATRRSVSTIQRAVDRLVDVGVITHERPRGRLVFRDDVPRQAIRELAAWQLGDEGIRDIVHRVHVDLPAMWPRIPERPHAHVRGNSKGGAKFWLEPAIEMASPGRYNERELNQIRRIIRENLAKMIGKWDEECARVQDEGSAR